MLGQLAVMSAFLGPDQDATETLLATDPEVLPWVQKYQRSRETVSQTDYEVSDTFNSSSSLVPLVQLVELLGLCLTKFYYLTGNVFFRLI